MHARLHKLITVALLCAPLLAQGAADTPPPDPTTGEPLEQVVVEATRANLVKLGKEVQASEQRFYKRYNELNKNRDYAIDCTTEATTGTRFTRTDCQPVFKAKAEKEEARQFLRAFGVGDQVTGTPGGVTGPHHAGAPEMTLPVAENSYGPAAMAEAAGRPGFRKNMINVTARSPELTRMAEEHAALWQRYYVMYRELNGAPPPSPEKSPNPADPAPSP